MKTHLQKVAWLVWVMVFDATFNNTTVEKFSLIKQQPLIHSLATKRSNLENFLKMVIFFIYFGAFNLYFTRQKQNHNDQSCLSRLIESI